MVPVLGGSNLDNTPPGSPTTPIAPFQAQYGQQHQQQQLQFQQQRTPAAHREFGQPLAAAEQLQGQVSSSSPSTAVPGADTSIGSISSTTSHSSINSYGQGHSGPKSETAVNIISNSILSSTINQSMANNAAAAAAAGGMNSNNSFFSVKLNTFVRDDAPGVSGSTSPLHHNQASSKNTSPTNSGAITRPPMSVQRNRDIAANRNANHPTPTVINTSFSTTGSQSVGGSATTASPGPIITSAAAEAAARESLAQAQAVKQPVAVSTAIATPSQPAVVVSGSEAVTAALMMTPATASSSTRRGSSSRHQQQQSNGHGHHHSHGHSQSHNPVVRKHKQKADSRDTPRPSTTVLPAPTPAMHWTRAKIHGQTPLKDLRAQTVNLVGDSIYVFGGCDAKTCYNTLYIFDADTMHWSQPKTFGSIPPPCRAHSSTLVDSRRLFVFGGGDGPQYFNELYMLDTDTLTWTNPQTTGSRPFRRRAHTTCVYNNHIYVFGGGDGVQALNDTYKLDLATMHWSEVKTTGAIPLPRGYHTSNLIKSQLIVFGGSDGHECFSDVHVLDLDTKEWTKIDINGPLPRLSHTATQVGSYLFVVGGHDGNRYSCDVVMLNLVTWSWETRKVYGIPPAGRGYHASLLYDSRLFMFGGYDGQTVFDDIYVLDLSTCAYLPQITDFQIMLRGVDSVNAEADEKALEDS